MKVSKAGILRMVLGGFVVLSLVISFQNCGKKDSTVDALNSPSEVTTTTLGGGGGTRGITVISSNNMSYSSNKTYFTYEETVYQKVTGLGPQAWACAELIGQSEGLCQNYPTNWVQLQNAGGWVWNSADQTWKNSAVVKDYHGMSMRQFFRHETNGTSKIVNMSFESAASANTSDIRIFYSRDVTGLQNNNAFKLGSTFYSHVKNGTRSMYACYWKVGTANPCTTSPAAAPSSWSLLRAEDAPDGNDTMLTYVNSATAIGAGQYWGYLTTDSAGTVKHGVWMSIDP